jgi:hypothetical protein
MRAELERRLGALETQDAGSMPSRPFKDWTVEEIRAEIHRIDIGEPPSEACRETWANATGRQRDANA